MKEIAGIDIGFGWTKVKTTNKEFKFPSWIAHSNNFDISEINPVIVDGNSYFVGDDATFGSGKIEITDIDTLINYIPVFVKYVKNNLGVEEIKIVTGLPPKYYNSYKDKIKLENIEVAVQGLGVLIDVESNMNIDFQIDDRVLILDIGFNTVDYLLALKKTDKWKKAGMSTIADHGLMLATKFFRDLIPTEIAGKSKNWSITKWIKAFENKSINIMGEKIDLSIYADKAIEKYVEMLIRRINQEIGDHVFEFEYVIVAGGGANILKNNNTFNRSNILIPEKPEFSNARGYYQLALIINQ